ncbi:hypothetical protein RZS08_08010, partial [Arthrospira platensis SPKY1]|nr:hypothetical protein [Arthrospira platensis SPKY1]
HRRARYADVQRARSRPVARWSRASRCERPAALAARGGLVGLERDVARRPNPDAPRPARLCAATPARRHCGQRVGYGVRGPGRATDAGEISPPGRAA